VRISQIIESRRPVFSFEFFPPKTDEGQQTLEQTLSVLKDDAPDYVSVTYGAGGTTRDRTVEITKWIKQDLGIEAMAHLSLVGEAEDRLVEILEEITASRTCWRCGATRHAGRRNGRHIPTASAIPSSSSG
jgi:methylenetetrahydrofolate reductase (NADH)